MTHLGAAPPPAAGAALESTRLAERELAAGRLVHPRAVRQRRVLRQLVGWLAAELDLELEPAI